MDIIVFALQGVFPVFLLIVIGYILKRKRVVGSEFNRGASIIGFKLALPALTFLKISAIDFSQVFYFREILILVGMTVAMGAVAGLITLGFGDSRQKGTFIQGSFRGNIVIIGMALILNLYGEAMAARAAMILAFMLPLFNIQSVIALTLPFHGLSPAGLIRSLKSIVTNPLIWGVVTGVLVSIFKVPVPGVLSQLLGYLSDLALPLALINIGASLNSRGIREKGVKALWCSLLKVALLPAAAVIIFYNLGYRQEELGMIFLITGAPAAVSSHIMAEAMENDGDLAALIVMISTALASLTTVAGISLIQKFF
ncbi:MAG: AEC family transporter [Spirochaetales bacterium]|nr:AEC family transporter [Spirochaetales bacterium]